MYKFILRLMIGCFIVMLGAIALMHVIGGRVHPLAPVEMTVEYPYGAQRDRLLYDLHTQIQLPIDIPVASGNILRSPNDMLMTASVDYEDDILHLTVQNRAGNPQMTTRTPRIATSQQMTWHANDVIYMLDTLTDDDETTIYAIDARTGVETFVASYELDFNAQYLFSIGEDFLMLRESLTSRPQRAIVNLQTNDIIRLDPAQFIILTREMRYIVYGDVMSPTRQTRPEDTFSTQLRVLNTQTGNETILDDAVLPPDVEMPIYATHDKLAMGIDGGGIFLYDFATNTHRTLDSHYELRGRWSADGTRLIVLRRGEPNTYITLNVVTGDEMVLMQGTLSQLLENVFFWSPEGDYLLNYRNNENARIFYQIYDAITGDVVLRRDDTLPATVNRISYWWGG